LDKKRIKREKERKEEKEREERRGAKIWLDRGQGMTQVVTRHYS